MKSFYIILFFIFITASAVGSEFQKYLKTELEKVRLEVENNPEPTWKILNPILDWLPGYILSADKNTWENPSAERLKRLLEVSEIIEPYVPTLIQLARSTKKQQGNPMAYSVLSYAKPSHVLKKGLLEIILNPKKPSDINQSLFLIFQLQLEDEEIKKAVISSLEKKYQDKNSFIYCDALDVSAQLRMPETVPLYKRFLEREIKEATGKSYTVQIIANAVQNTGESAKELRPLLEQYLKIVKETPQEQPSLEYSIIWAIETIDVKRQPKQWLKVNGAGVRQHTPDPQWYEKIVSQLQKEGNLPEILAKQNGDKPEKISGNSSMPVITSVEPEQISPEPTSDLIFGLTKRNLLSALMIAGGGALLVMTLLYAFWPRQK